MTAIAVLSKPYWRWWRWHKRQGHFRRPGAIAKPWNGIVTALVVSGLIALDQLAKHLLVTPNWAWHIQPESWIIYPMVACAVASVLILVEQTRIPAMLLLAGSVGNGSSELLHNRVANPFVTQGEGWHMAFNVADVYLVAALATFAYVAATLLVTHRPRRQPA